MPFLASNRLRSGFFNVVTSASYDTDAQEYFNAIVTNGGSIGTSARNAVNSFIVGLKADGLWSLIYDMGLFAGVDQLAAALVKVKTPLSSRLLTNVNFVSGDYVATGSTAGLKGNGSSKALDTLYNAGSSGTNPQSNSLTNMSVFAYVKGTEASGTTRWIIGTINSGLNRTSLAWQNGGAQEAGGIGALSVAASAVGSSTSWDGALMVTANGSNNQQYYRNGSAAGATVSNTGGAHNPWSLAIAAANGAATPSYSFYSTRYIRGYALTQGMNSTQAANLASRWNTLMTAFSANTY